MIKLISSNKPNIDLAEKDYASFKLSTNQSTNVANGNHVKWDTSSSLNQGTNISLDSTSAYSTTNGAASIGRITLKAGKKYSISSQLGVSLTASNASFTFAIFNADTGVELPFSTRAVPLAIGNTTDAVTNTNIAHAEVFPTIDTKIEIRFLATTLSTIDSTVSFITIESVLAYIPINRDILYAHIVDEKVAGTNGGTFTSGAWQTRDLNTIYQNDLNFVTLSSNQLILPQGTYRLRAEAPAMGVNKHTVKLYNISDSVDVRIGATQNSSIISSTSTAQPPSKVIAYFTIASTKTFEIQHRCQTTQSSTGFGIGSPSFSVVEVFTQVEIEKLR